MNNRCIARGLLAVVSIVVLGALIQLDWLQCPKVWRIRVVAAYPHDHSAFTQGLVIHASTLYEGTGNYGASSIRRVDLETGRVVKSRSLASALFGEGITVFRDRLYQLTWQSQVGIIYDVDTFETVGSFEYQGEGWGLTHDGEHLIMSDGSSAVRFLDPSTFQVVRQITVRERGQPVAGLNELEYIDGEIWANVWYQPRIVRISPISGRVTGWVDLVTLDPHSHRKHGVLNGIAFDADTRRLFVTGKNWPSLYEIEVSHPSSR